MRLGYLVFQIHGHAQTDTCVYNCTVQVLSSTLTYLILNFGSVSIGQYFYGLNHTERINIKVPSRTEI